MTYQKTLRKKGLHSRLVKKKRREDAKQQKAALKQGKKQTKPDNGPAKLIKPVFNSDGNLVSNKFDFADSEVKKENKRKSGTASSEMNASHESKVSKNDYQAKEKNVNHVITDTMGNGLKHAGSLAKQTNQMKSPLSNGQNNNNHSRDGSKSYIKFDAKKTSVDDCIRPKLKKKSNEFENRGEIPKEEIKLASNQGPVFNKDNKMVFSKVFIPDNIKPKKKMVKDPKKILQKIRENSKKILELEKEDKEKAVSLKEKHKWAAALKRASGEKVKDDPELLKKTITKEKNKKLRSQKKWQARIEHVQKDKEEKQKKRTENIQARKNEKKKRNMKKAVKKGSYVQL